MKKIGSRWIALMAVCVLLGLTVRPDVAYGAGGIETDHDCSITFDLSSNYQRQEGDQKPEEIQYIKGEKYEELQTLEIPVDVYKVADVEVSSKYKEPDVNQNLYHALKTELEKVSSQTTAAKWMSMADTAAKMIEADASGLEKKSTTLNASNTGDGSTIKNLSTGLYLVVAQEVKSPEYTYAFTPYLVSLPGNAYQKEGDSDEWLYDVTVGLKASRINRYGDLEIVKTLNAYNATLDGASFIFQIEAEKDGIIFSDVVSIVFDNAGTRSMKIEGKIPAGAEVTVTEVYSGASYELTSSAEQTRTVIADQLVTAEFTNDHDERLNGGTSIVNHFIASGDDSENTAGGSGDARQDLTRTAAERDSILWNVEQLTDSTGQAERSSNDEKAE